MSKKFGRLLTFAAVTGAVAAAVSYYLQYSSFNKELDEEFRDFEDGGEETVTARNYVALNKDKKEFAAAAKDTFYAAAGMASSAKDLIKDYGHLVMNNLKAASDEDGSKLNKAKDVATKVRNRATDVAEIARDVAVDVADKAKDTVADAAVKATEAAITVGGAATEAASKVKEGVSSHFAKITLDDVPAVDEFDADQIRIDEKLAQEFTAHSVAPSMPQASEALDITTFTDDDFTDIDSAATSSTHIEEEI